MKNLLQRQLFYFMRLQFQMSGLSLRLFYEQWSVRLGVRTPDFHSGNTGSIPVQTTWREFGKIFFRISFLKSPNPLSLKHISDTTSLTFVVRY